MKRYLPALVGLLMFFFLVPIAWAQGAAADDPTALSRAVDIAWQLLSVVLPIVAVWLTHRGIATFEKRTGINVPDSIENKIDTWVEEGIHLAAEKSYQKVKSGADKLPSNDKLDEAARYVHELALSRGWIDWSVEKIKKKIEAKLGVHRANGGVPKLDAAE